MKPLSEREQRTILSQWGGFVNVLCELQAICGRSDLTAAQRLVDIRAKVDRTMDFALTHGWQDGKEEWGCKKERDGRRCDLAAKHRDEHIAWGETPETTLRWIDGHA